MNSNELAESLRKKRFAPTLIGGYKKKEVTQYLEQLALEWEQLHTENQDLRQRLAYAEAEVSKLRSIESSLLDSLQDQRDANKRMMDTSKEEVRVRIAHAQSKAIDMIKKADIRARRISDDADRKYQEKLATMRQELTLLENNYKAIDKQTASLLKEMTHILKQSMAHLNKLSMLQRVSMHGEFGPLYDFIDTRLKTQQEHAGKQGQNSEKTAPTGTYTTKTTATRPTEPAKTPKKESELPKNSIFTMAFEQATAN